MGCVTAITALSPAVGYSEPRKLVTLEVSMKSIFLISGMLAGGLGFVIFFSSRATQEIEGLMLFLIGTVFLSVVVMMDTISGAQNQTTELLRELLDATRQRRRAVQEDPTGSKAKAQAVAQAEPATEAQAESQTETQVA
jgi:hypothetical protein